MIQISPYYNLYIRGVTIAKSNTPKMLNTAANYLEKALTYKETAQAYNQLLLCYMKLDNNELYKSTLFRAVKSGFTVFCSSLGYYYANSKEETSKKESLFWYSEGMNANEPKAFSGLGDLYLNGCIAFESNIDMAENIYLKGLKLNHTQYNGYFYWSLGNINYLKKQYVSAKKYYEKAIESNYYQANYSLAILYRDGLGVEKNSDKYIDYLLSNLCVDTALEIAGIYLLGKYAPEDKEISFLYFDYAANQGNALAAIMCAGLLLERKTFNEEQVNKYLQIFFSESTTDSNLQSQIDEIEEMLGARTCNKLKEYSEKYWAIRRGEA